MEDPPFSVIDDLLELQHKPFMPVIATRQRGLGICGRPIEDTFTEPSRCAEQHSIWETRTDRLEQHLRNQKDDR